VRLHNRSYKEGPVLYGLKFERGIEAGLPRGSFAAIRWPKTMIHSSDGSNYWLCVEKESCRLVKIKK
jgi:hypothetical protein